MIICMVFQVMYAFYKWLKAVCTLNIYVMVDIDFLNADSENVPS